VPSPQRSPPAADSARAVAPTGLDPLDSFLGGLQAGGGWQPSGGGFSGLGGALMGAIKGAASMAANAFVPRLWRGRRDGYRTC
jgi:hypothetical protein